MVWWNSSLIDTHLSLFVIRRTVVCTSTSNGVLASHEGLQNRKRWTLKTSNQDDNCEAAQDPNRSIDWRPRNNMARAVGSATKERVTQKSICRRSMQDHNSKHGWDSIRRDRYVCSRSSSPRQNSQNRRNLRRARA